MFLNISNHASAHWQPAQKTAALEYGEIIDLPFPEVSPYATADEINIAADIIFETAAALKPDCVMCSGEFTLTFRLVRRFIECGIKVVAACTERHCKENVLPSGEIHKEVVFSFVQFREYK